jgi:hypothetical protein
MSVIQPQVDCSSAKDFIDALSPVGEYFKDVNLSELWLFRGQGQDYPLIPSAFRKNSKLSSLTKRDIRHYKDRRLAERDILSRFFEIADRRGLMLPDDSQELRSKLEILKSHRGEHFVGDLVDWQPDKMVLSLAALAQHYGIPTRLLDWTRQAFIAAFFAAEYAWDHKDELDPSSLLVVWAFYFPEFGKHDEIDKNTDPLQVVTAPSATNPNLKAQQGVFTSLNSHYTNEAEGNYLPMDQVLEQIASGDRAEFYHKSIYDSMLRKFTLPVSEADTLLCYLAKLDITPSSVYPGFNSIIRDIKIENAWR